MTQPASFHEEHEQRAEHVAAEIQQQGSLEPAYAALDLGLEEFKKSGLPLESLVPAGERGLGFSARRPKDGKSFWEVYGELIRKELCTKSSKLHTLAASGTQITAGSLVGIVMGVLALPAAAIGIAAAIAGIIASLGIDAYCKFTEPAHVTRKTP